MRTTSRPCARQAGHAHGKQAMRHDKQAMRTTHSRCEPELGPAPSPLAVEDIIVLDACSLSDCVLAQPFTFQPERWQGVARHPRLLHRVLLERSKQLAERLVDPHAEHCRLAGRGVNPDLQPAACRLRAARALLRRRLHDGRGRRGSLCSTCPALFLLALCESRHAERSGSCVPALGTRGERRPRTLRHQVDCGGLGQAPDALLQQRVHALLLLQVGLLRCSSPLGRARRRLLHDRRSLGRRARRLARGCRAFGLGRRAGRGLRKDGLPSSCCAQHWPVLLCATGQNAPRRGRASACPGTCAASAACCPAASPCRRTQLHPLLRSVRQPA